MKVDNQHFRTIWLDDDHTTVKIIDQRYLPHQFVMEDIRTVTQMAVAIKDMHLRGAGLIGAAAGYGMYLATLELQTNDVDQLIRAGDMLKSTRPTAVNLEWAVNRQLDALKSATSLQQMKDTAREIALAIADEDAECCRQIGLHGLKLIEEISKKKNGETVNILTHCNAGWLAFVDYGSATAPIYTAFNKSIDVHVWVDETRPRNQGASLTAWELLGHGVPHTVIPDNTGGHLMQHGMVDMVITGTDRTTYTGDVANKIGTYLKALAAKDNGVPFYVALPSSTFDWQIRDGIKEIPIEERDSGEVRMMSGMHDGVVKEVAILPEGSPALNYGFDVTPARLVTGLISERGICDANEESVMNLFPEKRK